MVRSTNRSSEPTVQELADQARSALEELALRPELDAFQELLALSQLAGECVGESARALAANSSWAQVGDVSGTTKQAAWSRWSG